jgi:TolB-like protein
MPVLFVNGALISMKIGICLFLSLLVASCSYKVSPTVLKQGNLPDGGKICRIAVLPFVNQTKYGQAQDIFSRVFISELTNSGYQVAQEGDVRKFYQQMHVLPNQMLAVEHLRAMADMLGAQVIIAGTVLEMQDKSDYGQNRDPSIAVVIRIIEGASGRTLWATYNRREGKQYRQIMHFGLINSITSLAKNVSAEIFEAWNNEGFLKCTEQ